MIRWIEWWMWGRRRRRSRLRLYVGAALMFLLAARPVHLSSTAWWRSPIVASSISLTRTQRDVIDQLYRDHLAGRQRRIERLVAATNQLNQLLRDGAEQDEMLKGTQSVAVAAADERTFAQTLADEIGAVLSDEQRERLAAIVNGPVVD